MVEVGDIIEISDPNWKQKKVPMLGRRYEVKEIPNRRGNFPALKATPLKYKDEKGPTHPLYNTQADGSTWESSGFTHKGRTRTIPKNTYTVFQSSGTSSDSDATDAGEASTTPVFGMGGGVADASPADEPDDLPTVDISEKTVSVSEQVALAAKLFESIGTRSNKHFTPYPNDRELDYEKFPNYRIRLDEDNAKGMTVRVIFSAPIDEIDPVATYGTEADFFTQILNSRKGIVRQYTIGEPVEDVVNRAGNVLPLQWFKNETKWNEGGKVKGITIDFAPPKTDETSEPAFGMAQDASDDSDGEAEGFEGLGSLFGAEDMDGLSTYPRISVNLVADDGQEFTLTHTYQGDITLAFPEAEEEVVEETTSATPMFGGLVATSSMVGNPTAPTTVSTDTLVWNDVVMIPNYNSDMNRFPSTEKGAGDSAYDIRAVVGIDFDHDHSVFRPYEKPYEIDWDNAPSIMASGATGYVEAVFTVYAPNLPEGSVTDRLPGYFGESNPPYNPDWMQFPRKVSIILPSADAENMLIPSDGSDELSNCEEIKYYEHKGKKRDIQLVQVKETSEFNPALGKTETERKVLTATWKVGEDYEFETKNIGQAGYQTFKGELTGLIVNPNDSREPAFNSAEQSRRERRLDATNEKDSADIFFNKDETNPNTFVVVLKNEKDTPYSGQIIRVKLGGDR